MSVSDHVSISVHVRFSCGRRLLSQAGAEV